MKQHGIWNIRLETVNSVSAPHHSKSYEEHIIAFLFKRKLLKQSSTECVEQFCKLVDQQAVAGL